MVVISSWPNYSIFKQISATFICLLLHFSLGICQGFSAVLIPQLQQPYSEIRITVEEASWIASACIISMPLFAMLGGMLMDVIGRKRTVQLSFLPLALGWAIIALAPSVPVICIGRLITGFAIGMDPAAVVYIAETNLPNVRATVLSLTGPTVTTGVLISYLLGHFLYWRTAAAVIGVFSAFSFFAIFIIPESPVWLVSRDKVAEAAESLKWLRNETTSGAVNAELGELLQAKLSKSSNKSSESLARKIIRTKAWKPFLILTFYFALMQSCGVNVILYYAVNFYDAFGTPMDGFLSSLIYALLSLFFAVAFTATVRLFGRKTWTIVSSSGLCLSYLLPALYECIFEDVPNKPIFWFPLLCIWLSVAFGMIGVNSLPWLMAGELFPTEVRGVMTGVLWLTVYFYIFISVKVYPLFISVIKIYGVLAIFSVSSFVAILFGIFILPETKGMSLIEIEKLW